ncbi:MAG: response regulator [Pseudomonadota bacterium]
MLASVNTRDWPDAATVSDTSPSVMVVDDDTVAASELAETLEFEGFSCIAASTPEQALSILCSLSSIEVIITDFYLRGEATAAGNGLRLVETIREAFPDRKLEAIVISGDQDVLADCTITGAGKFLAKPIAPESICSMVREASLQGGEAPATPDEAASVSSLHRMVQVQADAITSLTEALNEARADTRRASTKLDRLVSAASIAGRRNEVVGAGDVGELLSYVVGQGYAVKKLLRDNGGRTKRPDPSAIIKVSS